MNRLSIRKQLLTLFVPFLFGLWIVSAILSYWLVSSYSKQSFDRDLINSADSVVGRLRVKEGKIVADLPPAAQAILKHDESDKLYYRVLGPDNKRISGDNNLPEPSKNLSVDNPVVVEAFIAGKKVRVAEIKVSPEEAEGQTVIVQLAETTNVRNKFQEKMLLSIAVPQFIVILVGLCTVWYGITKILTPLRLLQGQLASRSQFDLSALTDNEAPEEVYPLVNAINNLLDRLKEELKSHQRFIANAAHQLRTPLAGLKTYSSIGIGMTEPKDLRHIIHELDQGIDRASRIVIQLLALARADGRDNAVSTIKSNLDLNFLTSDVIAELIEQAINKNLELKFQASSTPAIVYGEQTGLRHLVANIVENAIMYTDSGGKVSVKIDNDVKVTLSVCDTGYGIPEEEREQVFERFYRATGTKGNGSGLGLSIVREVANSHDALVSIKSNPGKKGTLVLVEFAQTSLLRV